MDAPGDHIERVALADDALVERLGQLEHGFDFVLDHAAHRHAGPVLHDRGNGLLVDARQDERRLALQRRQLRLELSEIMQRLLPLLC